MRTPSFSLLLCFTHAPTPHSRAHLRPHPTRVTARRKDKLEELAKTINGGAGGKALAVSGDATIMASMTLLSFHGLQGP